MNLSDRYQRGVLLGQPDKGYPTTTPAKHEDIFSFLEMVLEAEDTRVSYTEIANESEIIRQISVENTRKTYYEPQSTAGEQDALLFAIKESFDLVEERFDSIIRELDSFKQDIRKHEDA